ncbi:MAG: hypothetical protein AAGF36_04510 [Pseudomonadota bacterium]
MDHIPEYKLIADPVDEAARKMQGFKWAAEGTGARHQLGGRPTFLQGTYTETCSGCSKNMTFYGQLDSIGDDIVLADAGLIHVWVCMDCFETKSVLQSG